MGAATILAATVAARNASKKETFSYSSLKAPENTEYVYRIHVERIIKKDNFDYEKLSNKNKLYAFELRVSSKEDLENDDILINVLDFLVQSFKKNGGE